MSVPFNNFEYNATTKLICKNCINTTSNTFLWELVKSQLLYIQLFNELRFLWDASPVDYREENNGTLVLPMQGHNIISLFQALSSQSHNNDSKSFSHLFSQNLHLFSMLFHCSEIVQLYSALPNGVAKVKW